MNTNEAIDKYIDVDGYRTRYRILGSGSTTVILVHGIGGYIEGWASTSTYLSKYYKVVILDLLGHGLSDKPDINYSIDMLTEFIIKFMNAINVETAVFAGHSLGGAICLNIAIKHPDKMEKLILVNSAGMKIPFGIRLGSLGILKKVNLKIPRFIFKMLSRNSIYDNKLITTEWLGETHRFSNIDGSYRVMFSIINSNMGLFGLKKDIRECFQGGIMNLKLPVLITCASDDKTVPNANSYHLHSLIPHSKLIEYENCRHLLPYECADKLAKDIIEFVSGDHSTVI